MEFDQLGPLAHLGDLGFQCVALRIHAPKLSAAGLFPHVPFYHHANGPGVLGVQLRQLPLGPVAPADDVGRQGVPFGIVGFDVGCDGGTAAELGLKTRQHRLFDAVEIEGPGVAAGAAFLRPGALHPGSPRGLVLDGHAGAAAAAFQQAGPQMLGAAALPALTLAQGPEHALNLLKHFPVYDRQVLRGRALPLAHRVDPGYPLAGIGVLDHADSVPHDLPAIERVDQDPMTALLVAAQGAGGPAEPARRGNPVNVEPMSDVARLLAGGELGKDAPDNGGFILDDIQLSRPADYRPIAIGPAAGVPAVPGDASHAAAHHHLEVFEVLAVDDGLDAVGEPRDLTVGGRHDLYPGEGQALPNECPVLLIAADAAHGFGYDDIEDAIPARLEHLLDTGAPVDAGAGHGAVGIDLDDFIALAISIGAANRDLILDRAIPLQVAGKPGVDGCSRHFSSPRIEAA